METKTYEIVDSVEALHGAIARVRAAQKVLDECSYVVV